MPARLYVVPAITQSAPLNPPPHTRNNSRMNIENEIAEIHRRIDNLIRTGVVTEVDLKEGTCRVKSGGLETRHLPVSAIRAGDARVWWPPSVGEQVTLICMSGNPETAVVLPGLFSDFCPQPDARPETLHIRFPDGAVIEYDAARSALLATGMKTASTETSESVSAHTRQATVTATTGVTLNTPVVTCTGLLQARSLSVGEGGGGETTLHGPVTQHGGSLSSNGVVLDSHKHGGVKAGGDLTGGPA